MYTESPQGTAANPGVLEKITEQETTEQWSQNEKHSFYLREVGTCSCTTVDDVENKLVFEICFKYYSSFVRIVCKF